MRNSRRFQPIQHRGEGQVDHQQAPRLPSEIQAVSVGSSPPLAHRLSKPAIDMQANSQLLRCIVRRREHVALLHADAKRSDRLIGHGKTFADARECPVRLLLREFRSVRQR